MSNEKIANAVEILAGLAMGMDPIVAVGQRQGQARIQMINESCLPRTRYFGGPRGDVLGIMLQWGVKLQENDSDPLFQRVELPSGWNIVTDSYEPMRSFLVDADGRQRATIFYKNSGYDEPVSSMMIIQRFSVVGNYHEATEKGKLVAKVMDGGIIELHRVELDATNLDKHGRFSLLREAEKEAECWLGGRYPRWLDPGAYWE